MISHPLTGAHRPPLSHVPSRGPGRPAPSSDRSPIGSLSQALVIDLTENDSGASDIDRPTKRQRLDAVVEGMDTSQISGDGDTQGPTDPSSQLDSPSSVRPPWSFQEQASRAAGDGALASRETTSGLHVPKLAPPPPLPIHPWKYRAQDLRHTGIGGRKDDVPVHDVLTTPYRLEIPPVAPNFKCDKIADFYPWTGSHNEDILNEQTVKQGFFDRMQVSQGESNTARPSIYVQCKHRSGLKVLSSVFAAALEERQARCKVTAPSTFKPPPRVTLTDIKREAWLRDLANPSVPLRRLSRTIPHGIRGKLLLDQCLSKSIPIGRAIWLAKCVGANEIRAFKRKGTTVASAAGLESKWIKDWTANAQQFIEGVIGSCGEPEWKTKISYAVRLVARLFLDHLLDLEHFLEWFLASLEAASLDMLPVWLLMLDIYWGSLVRYRKRGRRLAEYLLEKLRLALATDQHELLRPIIDRLSNLIKTFVQEHPSCFVLPQTWDKYETILASCLDHSNLADKVVLSRLSERNKRIRRIKYGHTNLERSPSQRLIRLLDSAYSSSDLAALSSECLKIQLDRSVLIAKALEWASTPFRHGIARIYVTVRLFRRWKKSGIDIDSHILTFLTQSRGKTGLCMPNVYHVISELVRSRSFSVGKYLQWLMARGVVRDVDLSRQTYVPQDIELLSHLPSYCLPHHIWNLRNTLLARVGFSATDESRSIQHIKASLQHRFPQIFTETNANDDAEMTDDIDLSKLTWTIKSEIGQWIRQRVSLHRKSCLKNGAPDDPSYDTEISALTADEFFEIRNIIEQIADFSMLADILKTASKSLDITVLVSAVDTLNYHFHAFNAIGAVNDLFKSFAESYLRVSKANSPVQDLISSLLDVGIRLPNEAASVTTLLRDLARFGRKFSVAASSPVSDHMADSLNITNPTLSEELDQLFSSGNSMEEQTMGRIFDTLTKRLGVGNVEGAICPNKTGKYLAQLRAFNTKSFDALMIKWVVSILKMDSRPRLPKILPPLIGVGCVTIQGFFTLVKKLLNSNSDKDAVPNVAALYVDMLELLEPEAVDSNIPLDYVSYRFRIARHEYLSNNSFEILGLVHDAISQISSAQTGHSLQSLLVQSIVPIVCDLVVRHRDIVGENCAKRVVERFPRCLDAIQQALNILLDSKTQDGVEAADETIQLTNDFSLPFCRMKLQLLFSANPDEETKGKILSLIFESALSDVRSGLFHWVDIVGVLDLEGIQQIRQRAERELLSLVLVSAPTQPNAADMSAGNLSPEESGLVYLSIIEELAYSIPEGGIPSFSVSLLEKMNALLQRVISMKSLKSVVEPASGSGPEWTAYSAAIKESAIAFWFSALLRLTAIHRSTLPVAGSCKTGLVDQFRLLITICCIALSPMFSSRQNQTCPLSFYPYIFQGHQQGEHSSAETSLQVYALDVAAALTDTLPEDARQQCARILRDRCPPSLHVQNDTRLLFLLGPVADPPLACLTQPPTTANTTTTTAPNLGPSTTNVPAHLQSPLSQSANPNNTSPSPFDDPSFLANRLCFQQHGRVIGPYTLRAWEMLEEPAPIIGVNDTALNLGYFGARQIRG